MTVLQTTGAWPVPGAHDVRTRGGGAAAGKEGRRAREVRATAMTPAVMADRRNHRCRCRAPCSAGVAELMSRCSPINRRAAPDGFEPGVGVSGVLVDAAAVRVELEVEVAAGCVPRSPTAR